MTRFLFATFLWLVLTQSIGATAPDSQDENLAQAKQIDPRITQADWRKLDIAAQKQFINDDEPEYLILFADSAIAHSELEEDFRVQHPRDIASILNRLHNQWPAQDIKWHRAYTHIPVVKISLKNKTRLYDLLANQSVVSVTQDRLFQLALTQSLPLISQPEAAVGGLSGEGVSIAIVDTGIDHTKPAFGCTAPGVPSSCRIAHLENIAEPGDVFSPHGTLVAAIAAGVATSSKIVGLDVKGPSGILTSDLIAAVDWIVANRAAYKIVAANFSLGSDTTFSSPCDNPYDPLFVSFDYLRANGVLPVAASGNGGMANGLSAPACYSSAFSVGATFDQYFASHTSCGGVSVNEDQVACFSNSADFLDMLAPGANVTAAGYQGSGTSMASPHVAGAAALIMSRYPNLTLAQLKTRLLDSSEDILDARNGYSFPRLDLSRALVPVNDSFANAQNISPPHTIADTSVFATAQTGEADGIQSSVWYRFTAGSPIYRVNLATALPLTVNIYQGSGSISQLTLIKSISAGNSSTLNLQAGAQYYVQVYSAGGGGEFDLTFNYYSDENIPFLPAWGLWGLLALMATLYREFR